MNMKNKTRWINIYRNKKIFELRLFKFTFRIYKKVVMKTVQKLIERGLYTGEIGKLYGVRFIETKSSDEKNTNKENR